MASPSAAGTLGTCRVYPPPRQLPRHWLDSHTPVFPSHRPSPSALPHFTYESASYELVFGKPPVTSPPVQESLGVKSDMSPRHWHSGPPQMSCQDAFWLHLRLSCPDPEDTGEGPGLLFAASPSLRPPSLSAAVPAVPCHTPRAPGPASHFPVSSVTRPSSSAAFRASL